ncbi:hypothetical protein [Fluviispira multicolorata]|uniref:Uncharacterized protein n=1 Tax=Fluviispira multicolorata TaxID=2654512 RepID=A0A833N6S9_9BACT|nr:hypothetical protein [Fluviispira multicolorata]KAB8030878.1 hypothetical protein GCL57_07845 [Fluviispira multicolorata]
MKTGILFWGFKDINLTAECAKKLKKNNQIRDVYIQISTHEKTISLMDIFPEEIIRCEYDDLNSLQLWLQKNDKKNIIVVIDFWPFLFSKKYLEKINYFKIILKMSFQFIIYMPKYYNDLYLRKNSKKLNSILDKTTDIFSKVKVFYELVLNSPSSIAILSSAPSISFLNKLCRQDFLHKKEISFFTFVPNLLRGFPASFLSDKKFLEELVAKIVEVSEGIQLYKSREYMSNFKNVINSDILNTHFKESKKNNKKILNFNLTTSIDRFYKIKSKEELKILLWCIYLGIIEYKQNFLDIASEESKETEMIFSRISV